MRDEGKRHWLFKAACKVVGRNEEQKSRFHSRRGEAPTLAVVVSSAPTLVRRITRRSSVGPWLVPEAVVALERELAPSDVVLELGGGASTRWLAERVGVLLTVEPHPAWIARIAAQVEGMEHVWLLAESVHRALSHLPATPSVVLIDHDEVAGDLTRGEVAGSLARSSEPKPRLIILDDSDRASVRNVEATLRHCGYVGVRYRGFRSRPWQVSETTIFHLARGECRA